MIGLIRNWLARRAERAAERENEFRPSACPYGELGRHMDRARASERKTEQRRDTDPGFDAAGFALGMATGVPLSPTHGFSTGAMIGAALHSSPSHTPAFEAGGGSSGGAGASSSSSSSVSGGGSCGGGSD